MDAPGTPRKHHRRRRIWIGAGVLIVISACLALVGAMALEARSDHSPDVAEALGGAPVDLLLAGHTHGGQVTVFGLWAPFVPSRYGQKYRAGLVTGGPVPVFVSTGVGTIVAPLRFFARPEVVLLTLKAE